MIFVYFGFDLVWYTHQALLFHLKQSIAQILASPFQISKKRFTMLQKIHKNQAKRDARDENIFISHICFWLLFRTFSDPSSFARRQKKIMILAKRKTLYNETFLLALHCSLI